LVLLSDQELANYSNGSDRGGGDEFIKSYVWKTFINPAGNIKYEGRQLGLLRYFRTLLEMLQGEFESQYEIYEFNYGNKENPFDGARAAKLAAFQPLRFKFKPYYGIPLVDRFVK